MQNIEGNFALSRLQSLENKIRVGIVGIGSAGGGMVYQSHVTPGIECVALADIHIERAIAYAQMLKREYRVVQNLAAMQQAIELGVLAICDDGDLVARCGLIDVFVESSNSITEAGRFCLTALEHQKHLVMVNAEADLIFGPYLMRRAQDHGVVYTSCDGDQHVVIKHLVDDLQLWGFELVIAGNIKGFLDRYSNPTKIIPEANKRYLDYQMAASYTDGTKLNIEMALTANALGLSTAVPGMHGPRARHVRDALARFDLPALWDKHGAVVDYVLGAEPRGGVFAIGYCDNAYQRKMLAWFPPEMGAGPFYIFYRPYHLLHVEAMNTLAAACLDHRAQFQPRFGFRTNVYAFAKRDLRQGEKLDGIGGYACYGLIENCAEDDARAGLPICLADGVVLERDVAKDERILLAAVRSDPNRFDFQLYSKALEESARMAR